MSDDDIRTLFQRIDDGPPAGVDVHAVMADGRRVRVRRTRLAVAGTSVAVVAAVAAGLLVAGGATPPEPTRPATPSTTPPPTSTSLPAPPPAPAPSDPVSVSGGPAAPRDLPGRGG